MQTMPSLGVTALIELPPAGTLTGLARRGLPGVQTLSLKSPGDLDEARELLAAHGAAGNGAAARADASDDTHSDSHAPEWRLPGPPPPRACPGGPARGPPRPRAPGPPPARPGRGPA